MLIASRLVAEYNCEEYIDSQFSMCMRKATISFSFPVKYFTLRGKFDFMMQNIDSAPEPLHESYNFSISFDVIYNFR